MAEPAGRDGASDSSDGDVSPSTHRWSSLETLSEGTRSMLLMQASILFCGLWWGFISFSAPVLHDVEGLSYTQIGSFIPALGLCFLVSVYIVGIFGDKIPHKVLIVGAMVSLIIGMALFTFFDTFSIKLVGFGFIGIGYSVYEVIPYAQIKLHTTDPKHYNKWFLFTLVSFTLSFGGGRLYMMLSVTYLTGYLQWRLPWIATGICQCAVLILVILFAKFYKPARIERRKAVSPPPNEPKNAEPRDETEAHEHHQATKRWEKHQGHYTYLEKVKALYLTPVALTMLVATAFIGYPHYSATIWSPTFAKLRFPELSAEEINWTISVIAISGMPGSVAVTALLLRAAKTVNSAVRVLFGAVLVGAGALYVFSISNTFLLFGAMFITALLFARFPYLYYKQLPFMLGFPDEIALFAISRWALVYSIVGDVIASFVTGVLLDETSVDTTMTVMALSAAASAGLFLIPVLLSFRSTGFLAEREQEQVHERAMWNWGKIRSGMVIRLRMNQTLRAFAIPRQPDFISTLMAGRFTRDGEFVSQSAHEIDSHHWKKWDLLQRFQDKKKNKKTHKVNAIGASGAGSEEGSADVALTLQPAK